jgi:hypothetical protein
MISIFAICNKTELEYFQNYEKISNNRENRNLCIARERWIEIEYSISMHSCLFWDRKEDKLTYPDFTNFDLTFLHNDNDEILFPRMQIPEVKKFYKFLSKNNLLKNCISKPKDYFLIENWMKVVPFDYTKRKMIFTNKELASKKIDNYFSYLGKDNGKFFIKSLKKDFSFDGTLDGYNEWQVGLSLESGAGEEEIILSEWVPIVEDKFGNEEYRCFFINGELTSISRYLDYEDHYIPDDILKFADSCRIDLLDKFLPNNIVIDLARTSDRGIILLEANDVMCSGRYVLNKVESILK